MVWRSATASYSQSARDHHCFSFFKGTDCPAHRYIIQNVFTLFPTEWSRRFRPADPNTVQQGKKKICGLRHPYILFVGSLEPRKNLKILLEAWEFRPFLMAQPWRSWARAAICSRKRRFDSISEGVRLLGRVEDEALPASVCWRDGICLSLYL